MTDTELRRTRRVVVRFSPEEHRQLVELVRLTGARSVADCLRVLVRNGARYRADTLRATRGLRVIAGGKDADKRQLKMF